MITVTEMKSRAVVFLTRPIDEVALIAGVERALDLKKTYLKETLEYSPPREQQVLPLLASGPPNKQAAEELGSPQMLCECTVDKSRGNGSRVRHGAEKIAGKPNL